MREDTKGFGIFGESCTGKSTLAVAEILKRL